MYIISIYLLFIVTVYRSTDCLKLISMYRKFIHHCKLMSIGSRGGEGAKSGYDT